MQDQAEKEDRPFAENIVCCLWATHKDRLGFDAGYHWARKRNTWDLPSFIKTYSHKYSLHKLWVLWRSMPTLVSPHRRADRSSDKLKASSAKRLEDYQYQQRKEKLQNSIDTHFDK